jgi:hypothetical protein
MASSSKDERGRRHLPRSFDQELRLRHKLIDVVVEAVVYAVNIP